MSRLKHVGQETTVTIRDREVRRYGARQGIILEDDSVFVKTPLDTFFASNKTNVI